MGIGIGNPRYKGIQAINKYPTEALAHLDDVSSNHPSVFSVVPPQVPMALYTYDLCLDDIPEPLAFGDREDDDEEDEAMMEALWQASLYPGE